MSSDRPVFVIGCPRSGTTLLTLMLSSHSRIAFPPETRFLLPVFRQHREFGDLREKRNRRRLARRVVRRTGTKFAQLGLERTRVIRAIVDGPPTLGSALAVPFRLYAADRGKARWGDKRPGHFRSVEVLRALFPDAQVVHIVRDPRDCVGSLARMPWWHHGTEGALATWVHAVDCAAAARRRLPPDSFHELRYEDLVTDPRSALTALCAFLGEDFEEAMLDHREVAAALPQRQRERWHQETQGAVCSRRVGTYAGVLTPAEVALVESAAGSRMGRLGYDLSRPARAPRGLRLGYLRAVISLRLRTVLRSARDRQLARPAGSVAAHG